MRAPRAVTDPGSPGTPPELAPAGGLRYRKAPGRQREAGGGRGKMAGVKFPGCRTKPLARMAVAGSNGRGPRDLRSTARHACGEWRGASEANKPSARWATPQEQVGGEQQRREAGGALDRSEPCRVSPGSRGPALLLLLI